MGLFRRFQFLALLISFMVIAINFYFIVDYITSQFGTSYYVFLLMAIPILSYLIFVSYLVCVCLIAMNICVSDLFRGVSTVLFLMTSSSIFRSHISNQTLTFQFDLFGTKKPLTLSNSNTVPLQFINNILLKCTCSFLYPGVNYNYVFCTYNLFVNYLNVFATIKF